jgi:hypothetical protein
MANENNSPKFSFPTGASKGRRGINLSEDNQALLIKASLDGAGTAKSILTDAMARHNAERAKKGLEAEEAPESYEKHAASLIYGFKQRFAQRLGKGNPATKAAAEAVGLPSVVQVATEE